MFDHLLESSHQDDSNKWSSVGFGEEIMHVEWIEVHFTLLIWSSIQNNEHIIIFTGAEPQHSEK